VIRWSADSPTAESFHAMPLAGPSQQVMGVLLVGSSRRPLIELQRQICFGSVTGGGAGILVQSWQPMVRDTNHATDSFSGRGCGASRSGRSLCEVEVESNDELGELAAAFNRMTEDLLHQKRTHSASGTRRCVAGTGAAPGARVEESVVSATGHGWNLIRAKEKRRNFSRKYFAKEHRHCWPKSTI